MITAVAKKKYGGKVTDFLEQHLPTVPKEDGSGMVDYAIKNVQALYDRSGMYCNVNNGKQGAVGGVFEDSKSCKMRKFPQSSQSSNHSI